ncbi:MAG: phosphatidate cytidylyltransferase [Candidatus Margulisbacteria bacterium]|nr:phosphatidate cytidylyltransferase [Candidatus Margulisiibacteriota bacterium]
MILKRKFSIKKLAKRALTLAVTVPFVVLIMDPTLVVKDPMFTYYAGLPFLIFVIAIAILMLNEFYHMVDNEFDGTFYLIGHAVVITIIFLGFFKELSFLWNNLISFGLSVAVVLISLYELYTKKLLFYKQKELVNFRAILYVGWCLVFLVLIRNFHHGKALISYFAFTVWAMDISAYMIGMLLGRHKLSDISPKKSIEGAVAGFLAAVITSCVILSGIGSIPAIHSLILGAIIGVIGQTGDLYESLIKRTYGVKDSSNILPGHGGILDRADSFILLAPIVYYYLLFIGL